VLWLYEWLVAQLLALAQVSVNTDVTHRHLLPCSCTTAVCTSHFCCLVLTLQSHEL